MGVTGEQAAAINRLVRRLEYGRSSIRVKCGALENFQLCRIVSALIPVWKLQVVCKRSSDCGQFCFVRCFSDVTVILFGFALLLNGKRQSVSSEDVAYYVNVSCIFCLTELFLGSDSCILESGNLCC